MQQEITSILLTHLIITTLLLQRQDFSPRGPPPNLPFRQSLDGASIVVDLVGAHSTRLAKLINPQYQFVKNKDSQGLSLNILIP